MPLSLSRTLALLLASLSALPAFAQRVPQDTSQIIAAQKRETDALPAKLQTLPAQCTLGTARGTDGAWVNARHGGAEKNRPTVYVFQLDGATKARSFYAALNPLAWRNLDKVESLDAKDAWQPAWTGKNDGPPAGCEYVKFEQAFEGSARDVKALRFTFRPGQGTILAAYVGVLKAE